VGHQRPRPQLTAARPLGSTRRPLPAAWLRGLALRGFAGLSLRRFVRLLLGGFVGRALCGLLRPLARRLLGPLARRLLGPLARRLLGPLARRFLGPLARRFLGPLARGLLGPTPLLFLAALALPGPLQLLLELDLARRGTLDQLCGLRLGQLQGVEQFALAAHVGLDLRGHPGRDVAQRLDHLEGGGRVQRGLHGDAARPCRVLGLLVALLAQACDRLDGLVLSFEDHLQVA
jgi:hypothetical protein